MSLPDTQELRIVHSERRMAEARLSALAAAITHHEQTHRDRPYTVRLTDLDLYCRLRQILGSH